MSSDAVTLERVSRVVGYKITKGDFRNDTPNLPQRIAILAEANDAEQGSFTADAPVQITSAKQAGDLFGYGSPIHRIISLLRPKTGGGVQGIPTIVFPQAEAAGATAKTGTITVSGTPLRNGTHYLRVAGRLGIEGKAYAINILTTDSEADIHGKIEDAINNVLGAPITATSTAYEATYTSKWKGLTANAIQLSIDTNGDDLGLTYVFAVTQAGSGTPDISNALDNFGNEWHTIVVNSYGTVTAVVNALEYANGIPDPDNPTGRWSGIVMKPFIALTGSVADNETAFTNATARKTQVTIAICPAPLSDALPFEAAANMAVLHARCANDTPHLDVLGKSYPDMPVPANNGSIGTMADYEKRDLYVQQGCSTVMLVNGAYQVQDFVTTYHPTGEDPPQYRYCRNIQLDWNVRFGYLLLEQAYVLDHALVADADTVTASKTVKPKQWKAVVSDYATDLGLRGLIADVPFMQASIVVNIGTSNPDRLETAFSYKRSGVGRISSTTAEAGFYFGTLTV